MSCSQMNLSHRLISRRLVNVGNDIVVVISLQQNFMAVVDV